MRAARCAHSAGERHSSAATPAGILCGAAHRTHEPTARASPPSVLPLSLSPSLSFIRACVPRDLQVGSVLGSHECKTEYDTNFAVVIYFALILYTFIGLAIVCDEYFCESLEKISTALSLSDDVAGALSLSTSPAIYLPISRYLSPRRRALSTPRATPRYLSPLRRDLHGGGVVGARALHGDRHDLRRAGRAGRRHDRRLRRLQHLRHRRRHHAVRWPGASSLWASRTHTQYIYILYICSIYIYGQVLQLWWFPSRSR